MSWRVCDTESALARWAKGPVAARRTAGDGGTGSRYTVTARVGPAKIRSPYEVTGYDPPARFAGHGTAGPVHFREEYRLTADGTATILTQSIRATPRGPFRLADRPLRRQLQQLIASDLGLLQKFGTADVSAVSGGTAATGQSVILAAAAATATEDWSVAFQGVVSDFYAAGLMSATLNEHYGSDPVYEFRYKPGGASSTECLGIAPGPGPGTKVTLQPCGQTANTAWIDDIAAASGGYVPYISGSDTQYPAPCVLTAAGAGGNFTTQALSVNSGESLPATRCGNSPPASLAPQA